MGRGSGGTKGAPNGNKVASTSVSDISGLINLKKALTLFNSNYTDLSKVELSKTPKGNWEMSYDGHVLGILDKSQISNEAARNLKAANAAAAKAYRTGSIKSKKKNSR